MTSFTFICDARCCQLGSTWVQVCLSWLMHSLCLSRPQCPSRGTEGTTWSRMLIATHLWMFSCQEKCCCDKFIVYHTCSVCHCCRYCFPQSSSLFTWCHHQATCSNQRPGASFGCHPHTHAAGVRLSRCHFQTSSWIFSCPDSPSRKACALEWQRWHVTNTFPSSLEPGDMPNTCLPLGHSHAPII